MKRIRRQLGVLAALLALLVTGITVTARPGWAEPECNHVCGVTFTETLNNYVVADDDPFDAFNYQTNTRYWSAVAIRPKNSLQNYDLGLWSAKPLFDSTAVAKSQRSGSQVDFIAIDSNTGRQPYGTWYASGWQMNGANKGFDIELAQGTNLVYVGTPQNINIDSGASNRIVVVRDVYLQAGKSYTIKLKSPSPSGEFGVGADGALFLMASTAGAMGTYVQSRSQAARSSDTTGVGGLEQFTFTPSTSAYYGLVLVHKTGWGTYTLTVTQP